MGAWHFVSLGVVARIGGHAVVFWEYLIFLPRILFNGLRSAAKGNRSRICFYEKA